MRVPWEITIVEKGTLGQAARMAAVGSKKALKVPNAKPTGKPSLGQKDRMSAVTIKSPKRKGVPSWANRAPGDVGPHLNMSSQGFKMLTGSSGGGGKSLIPTRTMSGGMTGPPGGAAQKKKRGLALPASIGVGAGLAAGALAGTTQQHEAKKGRVRKGLVSTLGKPMPKPGGSLKPVQPPKPAAGPKPVTGATGPKPVTQPAGPPATLRPPSMMPPKPGQQPQARR